jgi:GTP-binding protein EngB required for normal cell division
MARRKGGDMMHGVREAAQLCNQNDGKIDAREGMATTVFTVESLGLKSTYGPNKRGKGKGKGGTYKRAATTVLAGEAIYDVERRVRDARRALGSYPAAFAELLPSGFDLTRGAVTLMPARPKWDYELKRGRLHSRERKAFVRWIAGVKQRLIASGTGYAPAFEQNIEVWRQLWRVLERADVAVLVVDARHPLLHVPPALYAHVARRLRKPLVLVLNKVDAIPRRAAEEWARHLLAALPGVDAVVGFTSKDGGGGAGGQKAVKGRIGVVDGGGGDAVSARERLAHAAKHQRDPRDVDLGSGSENSDDDDQEHEESSSAYESEAEDDDAAEGYGEGGAVGAPFRLRVGHVALLKVCRQLAEKGKRDALNKQAEAAEAAAAAAEEAAEELEAKAAVKDDDIDDDIVNGDGGGGGGSNDGRHYGGDGGDDEDDEDDEVAAAALQAEAEEAAAAKDGRVMIGLVGHPNVGKSSMVNYILGRKAVSVKATPGHTKTLQTLILDEHTCLCDSPGLVFPRVDVGLAEQIIGGLVPLPVVREPYSAVRWLAELRDATAARWSAVAADCTVAHPDRALASALATTLSAALKIPPMVRGVIMLLGHRHTSRIRLDDVLTPSPGLVTQLRPLGPLECLSARADSLATMTELSKAIALKHVASYRIPAASCHRHTLHNGGLRSGTPAADWQRRFV